VRRSRDPAHHRCRRRDWPSGSCRPQPLRLRLRLVSRRPVLAAEAAAGREPSTTGSPSSISSMPARIGARSGSLPRSRASLRRRPGTPSSTG
jgi:hypothetical protein